MKVWKLVSGIISMVVFIIIVFQSCATGVVNALDDNDADTSAAAGIWVAFILLVAGLTSACVWKEKSRWADFALISSNGFCQLGHIYRSGSMVMVGCYLHRYGFYFYVLASQKGRKTCS